MSGAAVVTLARILHDQLPIGALHQCRRMSDLAVAQIVRAHKQLERSADRLEVRCGIAQAHINQAGGALHPQRTQPIGLGIKALLHPTRAQQLAMQVVGPLMIGAYQPMRMAALFGAHLGAAVPAAVEECADASLLIAQNHNR